jgi:hypothetical protein
VFRIDCCLVWLLETSDPRLLETTRSRPSSRRHHCTIRLQKNRLSWSSALVLLYHACLVFGVEKPLCAYTIHRTIPRHSPTSRPLIPRQSPTPRAPRHVHSYPFPSPSSIFTYIHLFIVLVWLIPATLTRPLFSATLTRSRNLSALWPPPMVSHSLERLIMRRALVRGVSCWRDLKSELISIVISLIVTPLTPDPDAPRPDGLWFVCSGIARARSVICKSFVLAGSVRVWDSHVFYFVAQTRVSRRTNSRLKSCDFCGVEGRQKTLKIALLVCVQGRRKFWSSIELTQVRLSLALSISRSSSNICSSLEFFCSILFLITCFIQRCCFSPV